jgi:hypothetical protein
MDPAAISIPDRNTTMFERFSRSWSLIKASGAVLQQDKELLVFPLCSAIATLVLMASFAIPLFATGALERFAEQDEISAGMMLLGFAFYLSQYFVIFFFNTALVGAAMIRLGGGDPTVADGLRIARSKLGPILGYAAIAATVGLVLRLIEERAGFVGRWIAGLLGMAFTVASFLTAPILVSRDIGPIDAVKESAALLKRTWGENIIGNGGLGIAFGLFYVLLVAIAFASLFAVSSTGSRALIVAWIGLFVLAAVALGLVQSALQGVYSAALYRYATEGEGGHAFTPALLGGAFRPK